MLEVEEVMPLNAPAQDVWNVIGNFGGLADWHPAAIACVLSEEGTDTVRTISIPGGGSLVEKLEAHDDGAMSQTYSIVDGPLPMTAYMSTIRVLPETDTSCRVHWVGRFEASGAPDEVAQKVVRGIYTAGLSALAERFK
jgi:hypothetical protein